MKNGYSSFVYNYSAWLMVFVIACSQWSYYVCRPTVVISESCNTANEHEQCGLLFPSFALLFSPVVIEGRPWFGHFLFQFHLVPFRTWETSLSARNRNAQCPAMDDPAPCIQPSLCSFDMTNCLVFLRHYCHSSSLMLHVYVFVVFLCLDNLSAGYTVRQTQHNYRRRNHRLVIQLYL